MTFSCDAVRVLGMCTAKIVCTVVILYKGVFYLPCTERPIFDQAILMYTDFL